MRQFSFLALMGATFLLFGSTSRSYAAERPNFVWLLSEDNSKHYLELFDEQGAPTPNIAALARDGIVFERAFSCSPVCSVARTTLMTGCYGPRIGTQFHRKIKTAPMPEGFRMFPAYLRDAGYYTTNNSKKDYNAVEGKGVWDQSSKNASWRKRPKQDQPFFHMQSFGQSHESSLHFPQSQVKPENLQTSVDDITLADYHPDTPIFRYTLARYHDRIREIDRQIGNVVSQLKEDGLLEDTFIFYFGDHGGVLPRSKGYLYESGLHVPLVVRVPKNFQDQVQLERGSRTQGFVQFFDFGPTVLHLAGIDVPSEVDGRPFLGPKVLAEELAARDEAIGYADRFDEKYDLVRSLRKGRFKYIRNYQAFYPDGLQNNYRYRMLAYSQWRKMHAEGKLNGAQRAFFEAKPVEALYDLEADPHEVNNLATDPQHARTLVQLRKRLRSWLDEKHDLSAYPDSHLIDHALENPTRFGEENAAQIRRLWDTADLALLPFDEARPELEKALASSDPLQKYWALTACSCFGKDAAPLYAAARQLLEDEHPLVRLRAAEFLGITGQVNPQPLLAEILNDVTSPVEALIILNSVVYFQDAAPQKYAVDTNSLKMKVKSDGVRRRLDYLTGKL